MWRRAKSVETRFDIVHATAFPYAWPIACGLRMARRLGVPFVVTPFLHLGDPHDPRDPTRRAYTSPALLSLLGKADRVFVQTPGERDELRRRGFHESRVVLQGLGVDIEECTGGNREQARREWHINPGETVIGHLANNSREKGTIDLVQAAARLWRSGVPVRLILAGPEMPNFKQFMQGFLREHPAAATTRLGILTDKQRRDFFAGIDVFALPSRSDSFGLVLLEAWANGVPNVGYDSGGIRDVIRHEIDGLLARCGNIDGLASALARLHLSPDLRKRLAGAGCERIARDFSWNEKLDVVKGVYEGLTMPAQSRGHGTRNKLVTKVSSSCSSGGS